MRKQEGLIEMKDERLTIIVGSCDKYKDIAEHYLRFLRKNWPQCPYRVLVAMEEEKVDANLAETVLNGKGATWTKEIINSIARTSSQYILLTVDDLFISEPVDGTAMEDVVDFIEKNKILYYRIPKFIELKSGKKHPPYPGSHYAVRIPKNSAYNVTIGSSIWERSELLRILGDGTKSAWDLEDSFLEQAANSHESGYLEGYASDSRLLLNSIHAITAGRWIRRSVKQLRKLGYNLDFDKRGYVSQKNTLRSAVYRIAGRICPIRMRKTVKKFLKKVGFKFVTNN